MFIRNIECIPARYVPHKQTERNAISAYAGLPKKVRDHFAEYDKQLADLKATLGMDYEVTYRGQQVRKGWNNQIVDAYQVTFRNLESGETFELPYYCGLGHRHIIEQPDSAQYRQAFITPPHPLSALHCIWMDDPRGETFEGWCDGFDLETDSRQALKMYLECQQQADAFRRTFPDIDLDDYEPLENY